MQIVTKESWVVTLLSDKIDFKFKKETKKD